jgi:peptidoglycan/LPS O-acetylase OafA/YrhL
MPGLDGLRALAVIAVLLYHAGIAWIPGGFLGVEVFFVLSGYLITALLLAEWRAKGSVNLKTFWLRRARRLLPALYLLIVVSLAYAVVFLPEEVAGLRADALAAFAYVTNWYLVIGQESYFEAVGRPSLLQHLWSLAVEEQFYLFWPLVFWVGISFGATRWRKRRVLMGALGVAALSVVLMALMYVPGVDPSRLYYGTDTRAFGLLIGAALALVWMPGVRKTRGYCPTARRFRMDRVAQRRGGPWGRFRRRWGWTAPLWLDALGLAALGALVFFCFHLGEFDPFLYRGGLALVSISTAALIMCIAHPYTRLGALVLGWAPLRWIGERSYGIYLWHWPVFMVTRPQLDVALDGLPLLALRLSVTVLLAHLSYRYVEMPIRTGALEQSWKALRDARGFKRWDLGVRWAGATVPAIALCVALGMAVAHAKPPETPDYLATKAIHTSEQPAPATEPEDERQAQRSFSKQDQQAGAESSEAPKPDERPEKKAPAASDDGREAPTGPVSAIGDSVMLGAAAQLEKDVDQLRVMDAQVALQVATAIDILEGRRATGQIGDVVVVHLGNNGTFTAEEFDEIMRVLSDARKVVFVNNKVPRTWETTNNEVLADGTRSYDKAVLVDWRAASIDHPEYFAEDGIHLQPAGQRAYSDLISAEIESR